MALFLTVEIMSRVPWPAGRWWSLGRWVGAGTVALVAAVTSYSHMHGLLLSRYGEDRFIAAIQPASVDGLMIVASLALLALGQHTTRAAETSSADTEPGEPTSAASVPQAEREATTHPSGDEDGGRTVRDLVPPIPADLITAAQRAADQHQHDTGRPITRDAMRAQLRVSNATAGDLLRLLKAPDPAPVPIVPAVPTSPNGRPAPVPERR